MADISITVGLAGADQAVAAINKVAQSEEQARLAAWRLEQQLREVKVSGVGFDDVGAAATRAGASIEKVGKIIATAGQGGGLATSAAGWDKIDEPVRKVEVAAKAAAPAVAQVAKEVSNTGLRLTAVRTLEQAFGFARLPMINADLRIMQGIVGSLGLAGGGLTILAAALAAAGAVVAKSAVALESATAENASQNAAKLLGEINKRLAEGEEKGTLSSGDAGALRDRLRLLEQLQSQVDHLTDVHPRFSEGELGVIGQVIDDLGQHVPKAVREFVSLNNGTAEVRDKLQSNVLDATKQLIFEMNRQTRASNEATQADTIATAQEHLQIVEATNAQQLQKLKSGLDRELASKKKSNAEKIEAVKTEAEEELRILDENYRAKAKAIDAQERALKERRDRVKGDPTKNLEVTTQINALESEKKLQDIQRQTARDAVENQRRAQVAGLSERDPGFVERLTENVTQLGQSWGAVGKNAADALTNGVQASLDGVAASLTGLIFRTQSWGQVFLNVGEMIVGALIKLAIQFLATAAAAFILDLFTGGAGGAAVAGGSLGGSSITGAASEGGFASGGFIKRFASGGANLDTVPAMLSPGEAVIRAGAVSSLGSSFIGGINNGVVDLGRLPGRAQVMAPGQGSVSPVSGTQAASQANHFHFAFHDDGSSARQYLESVEGQKFLVDSARQTVQQVTGRA
jgi:hypothetical protein